jgi:hypothetical protein
LDFPQPLGPTIPVIPASKWMTVRSLNDLKPMSSSFLILNVKSSVCVDLGPALNVLFIVGHVNKTFGSWERERRIKSSS